MAGTKSDPSGAVDVTVSPLSPEERNEIRLRAYRVTVLGPSNASKCDWCGRREPAEHRVQENYRDTYDVSPRYPYGKPKLYRWDLCGTCLLRAMDEVKHPERYRDES